MDFPGTFTFGDGINNNLALHDHLLRIVAELMHIENLEHVVLIVQEWELQWLGPFYGLLV